MTGFIYVVQSSAGLVKIGYTNNPRRRLTMLRTSSPDRLTLLGVVPGTMEHEKELHRLLKRWCVAREWFKPCAAMRPLLDALTPLPGRRMRRGRDTGHPLRAYRAENGIALEEIATLMGTTRMTISRWETGEVKIPPEKVRALTEATGVPAHELRPDLWGAV